MLLNYFAMLELEHSELIGETRIMRTSKKPTETIAKFL